MYKKEQNSNDTEMIMINDFRNTPYFEKGYRKLIVQLISKFNLPQRNTRSTGSLLWSLTALSSK